MKRIKSFSILTFTIAFLAFAKAAHADDQNVTTKYFRETKLPTHSDGIQRFEPSNFISLKNLNAFELIGNIVELNKIDAEYALVLWNNDFFKNDEELSDELLQNTPASEIRFIEIFDGEGNDQGIKPNKIINLITKVHTVEAEPTSKELRPILKSSVSTPVLLPIKSKIEFDAKSTEKKPQIATVFDEQGRLENAQIYFGETANKALSTSLSSTQPLFGQEFFLEAKFKKKQIEALERSTNIIGVTNSDFASIQENQEESLALNSILKSKFLGFNATASISGQSVLKSENSGLILLDAKNRGTIEKILALIQLENKNISLSAGAETKSLTEVQINHQSKASQQKYIQSRAFAKFVSNWQVLDFLSIKGEIGGDLYNVSTPYLIDANSEIFALTSRIIAVYGDKETGTIKGKFEIAPGEYYRNNQSFIVPLSNIYMGDFNGQNNRNLEISYEKQFSTSAGLKLVFENRDIQDQYRTIAVFDNAGQYQNSFGDFGDSKYQKFSANYRMALPFLTDARLNSGLQLEKEISPKAKLGSETFFGESKKQNYQIDFTSALGEGPNSWGAFYEHNTFKYYNGFDGSLKASQKGNVGVFMNFDYGDSGAIRAELNSNISNAGYESVYDKQGNIYSTIDFSNTEKPRMRLIYMKKM